MDALEFIRVRELDVAVRIWNPKATRTLIAWHGLARHGGDFAALARELGSEWRIIAPDTPGRGLSSWSLSTVTTSPLPLRCWIITSSTRWTGWGRPWAACWAC